MSPLPAHKDHYPNDYSACSGCSLCLLVCPVWRQKRDLRHTSQGRAKAFQHGARPADLGDALFSCAMCGSCNTICPEGIDLKGILASLRRDIKDGRVAAIIKKLISNNNRPPMDIPKGKAVFLPGINLGDSRERIERITALLGHGKGIFIADYDGWDIGLAFEAGVDMPVGRLERFLDSLRGVRHIVVGDGIMKRVLRMHLPKVKVTGVGEELSSLDVVKNSLLPTDLYVIESRSYNIDFEKLSRHYDRLRNDCRCAFNLDLHMAAVPTTATSMHRLLDMEGVDSREQARWILKGRDVKRIVVESMEDGRAFMDVTDIPVVHLADIVDDSRGGI